MKNTIVFFLFMLLSMQVFSQRTIILNNGDRIAVKDYRFLLKTSSIQYTSKDGNKSEIKNAEIFCIQYKKMITVFNAKGWPLAGKVIKGMPEMSPKDSCSRGIVDAIKNYKPTGAKVGTGIVSFVAWPVGLVTAIVVSSVPPAERHLRISEVKVNDNVYTDCYKKEASRQKKSATWMGWSLGTSMGILISSLLILL